MKFIQGCPPFAIGILLGKGAMGDSWFWIKAKNWTILNSESHPPALSVRFRLRVQKMSPFEGGLLSFPTQRVGGINPLFNKNDDPSTRNLLCF